MLDPVTAKQISSEALLGGGGGGWGTRVFISGEQGQFWRTGNIGNQDFDFMEQGNGTREQVPPLLGRPHFSSG